MKVFDSTVSVILRAIRYILHEIGVSTGSLYIIPVLVCVPSWNRQNTRMILSDLAYCVNKAFLCHNYPVCVCAVGLCVWSRWFVYMWPKKQVVLGLTT